MSTNLIRAFLALWLAACALACGDDDGGKKCAPGNAGCACLDGDTCNGDLACMDGLCQGAFDVGLSVSDGRARGCDVLVTEQGSRVSDIAFTDAVKGTFVREAPRVAISFISASDAPIDASGIQLQLVGEGTSGLNVESVECADRTGNPLDGVSIALKN